MKGLFPWLRELFFGVPEPKCHDTLCKATPAPHCTGTRCGYHCKLYCKCPKPIPNDIEELERLYRKG